MKISKFAKSILFVSALAMSASTVYAGKNAQSDTNDKDISGTLKTPPIHIKIGNSESEVGQGEVSVAFNPTKKVIDFFRSIVSTKDK